MRLRTKLSIVLALLVSTLVANVGLSVWSIRFLEQELSTPLRSMQSVMHRLHEIKLGGEREVDLLREAFADPATNLQLTLSKVSEIESYAQQQLDELEALPSVMLRSGITTIDNMQTRSKTIRSTIELLTVSQTPEDAENLITLLDTRRKLIERIEGQILDDAQLAADFGDTLKSRMELIILITLIGALAIGVIMVMFIRRWVLSPIEQLREGALRMAQGDFNHPIEVTSRDELGQLSDEFNRMGELIQDMQARKIEQERLAAMGEMAQRTVHNLRTPLAGIRALSETTQDELPEDSDLRDLQGRIISTVDKFEVWLKEMLRTSTPLELTITEFSPQALVESVIDAHRDAAASENLKIELISIDPPSLANGDAHHLEHAITAILSNAVAFATESTTIRVNLAGCEENQGGYWTLRVANDGPMVPPDLQRTIFRPYFTTRQSGTGIGLALTKRVINQHSGLIEIESPLKDAQETGCAFVIKIPLIPTEGIQA